MPVIVADVAEAVATGAAVQAAALVEEVDHAVIQDRWGRGTGHPIDGIEGGSIRERYAALRDR